MSSFKSPKSSWKTYQKSTEFVAPRPHSTLSRRESSQGRPLTATSKRITTQESSSTVKRKYNNVLPTTRIQTIQREETRFTSRNNPTNVQRTQQTFTQRSTQVTHPCVHTKMSLLPASGKSKGICSCVTSSTRRKEVLKNVLSNYKPSAASSLRTSLPERLYKGSKLPRPVSQLGRKLPAVPEKFQSAVTSSWIKKAESERRSKAKTESPKFEKHLGTSKIPRLLTNRPSKPKKETIRMNSASLKRLLSDDVLYQFSDVPVPVEVEIPMPELALMNQKLSQLRCVLATLQGTVNTMEKSIREICPADETKELMLSKSGLKSNFESMGRVFKTVNNTLLQLKDLNMKALGFYGKEMLPKKERTFIINEDSNEAAAKKVSDATIEDTEIFGKGLDVIRTALDVSLSKDEDITVEELRNQIVDAQIDLLDDAVMSPAMSITDQLIKTEQIKNRTIQEAEDFICDQQSLNPNKTIDEAIEQVKKNQLDIKAHELVMEVLTEALQDDQTLTISDLIPGQIKETESNMSTLITPIMEDIFTREGNISVFELELSLQEAANILEAIDSCPSVTMASFLDDVLASGSFKTTVINKYSKKYCDLTVGDMQENLKLIQNVFHNAELHPEFTTIGQLLKSEYLSENPLIGKILRKEGSSNPGDTILSLELKISDLVNYLTKNACPQTKLCQLQLLPNENESEENVCLEMIKNVRETLRASVEASENVADVVMEAIVEASLKENPAISLAETKQNVIRSQMFLAVSSPSLTSKIVDLNSPDLLESAIIPGVISKAVAVRENISVSQLHQSFEEVKERLSKAAVAPHMIRLFYLLHEPNRLHLSPKCALLKDTILTSSEPLALYWKNYYAEKLPQVGAGYSCLSTVKLKVKIIKNVIEYFQGRECNTSILIKMVKKWKNMLSHVRPDQSAVTVPMCKWISLSGFSQSITEEIACRHPLRRVSGLLDDVTIFIEQLNSVKQIGNTVDVFEPEPRANDSEGLAFQEIAVEIVDVARSVDRDMPVKQLSMKMEILKENLEEFIESSVDATVSDVITEVKLQQEVFKRVVDVVSSTDPCLTASQMQKCLLEVQNDLENVAIVPNQIAISSLCVEDPVFSEEMILYTKNEIINEAVKHNPNMSLEDLKEAIGETHKCLLSSKLSSFYPNQVLQTPNNFVMRAIRGCAASLGESFSDMMELLEKVGRNVLSSNSVDPNRTVQEEQEKRLEEEEVMKEFNPFDIVYLANQYPPMRHAVVANVVFKPLAPHTFRPFIPNLLKNNTIEMLPKETPVDFNGREDVDFDFLDSNIQPYSYYKKHEYASNRSHEESTKVLFYEK